MGLIDSEPPPLLGKALVQRSRQRSRDGVDPSRKAETRAGVLAKDLSCTITAIAHVGPRMLRRRKKLLGRAEAMGLGSLPIGRVIGRLAARANLLGRVYSARARCKRGVFFLLVSPPTKAIDPDEDPRAHGSAGWSVFTIGTDARVLVRGGAARKAKPRPIQADRIGGVPVDPWIPLGGIDL